MSEEEAIRQAKELHKKSILAKPNVVGVGMGYKVRGKRTTDELCLVALVRQKIPKAGLDPQALVPADVDEVPTDVVQVGELRALLAPTDRWRPAPGGVSLGHYKVTAGTFGCVVRDRDTHNRLILSNNHVLANSNAATIGDPIVQPGTADGGRVPEDVIAHLERFCPIEFGTSPPVCGVAVSAVNVANRLLRLVGSRHRLGVYQSNPAAVNLVDAALARPVNDADVLDQILQIGAVQDVAPAALGMEVRKSGRTTGCSTGEVMVVDATVDISYGIGVVARFDDQIVTTAMSQGGDSGSLLVAGDALKAVGLLFAGSEQTTVHNSIQQVLDSLHVELVSSEAFSGDELSPMDKAEAVKTAHQDALLSKPNVVGVGTGLRRKQGVATDDVAVVVMVRKKLPQEQLRPEDVIPSQIDGVPIDVQEVGDLKAL